MIKISHNNDHVSIKHFEPFELDDFSILTGSNGSGKTHLLEAIDNGCAVIDGITQHEVIYYNYTHFRVNVF